MSGHLPWCIPKVPVAMKAVLLVSSCSELAAWHISPLGKDWGGSLRCLQLGVSWPLWRQRLGVPEAAFERWVLDGVMPLCMRSPRCGASSLLAFHIK